MKYALPNVPEREIYIKIERKIYDSQEKCINHKAK